MKKCIAIIPLVILLVFVTPFSVAATELPDNVTNQTFSISMELSNGQTFIQPNFFKFGIAYQVVFSILTNGIDSFNTMVENAFAFSVLCEWDFDMYIMHPKGMTIDYMNFRDLWQYYDESSSFDYTLTGEVLWMNIESTDMTYEFDDSYSRTNTVEVTFSKFNDVPWNATAYTFIVPSETVPQNASSYLIPYGVFVTRQDSNTTPVNPGGGVPGGGEDNSLYDVWYDESASFADNVASINTTFRESLAAATTDDERMFYAAFAQYQLDIVKQQSDEAFVGSSEELFNINFYRPIYDFMSGLFPLSNCIQEMSDGYRSLLTQCSTVEQGIYVSTLYQVAQEELYRQAQLKATQRLNSAISDEEMDATSDYYAAEDQLLSMFKIQDLEDTVNYNQWFNLLMERPSEVSTYRAILDYFLTDASWSYWITLPMSFMIVSIVLGTGISLYASSKRKSGSDGGKSGGG